MEERVRKYVALGGDLALILGLALLLVASLFGSLMDQYATFNAYVNTLSGLGVSLPLLLLVLGTAFRFLRKEGLLHVLSWCFLLSGDLIALGASLSAFADQHSNSSIVAFVGGILLLLGILALPAYQAAERYVPLLVSKARGERPSSHKEQEDEEGEDY